MLRLAGALASLGVSAARIFSRSIHGAGKLQRLEVVFDVGQQAPSP
jgi:hypothetical protein